MSPPQTRRNGPDTTPSRPKVAASQPNDVPTVPVPAAVLEAVARLLETVGDRVDEMHAAACRAADWRLAWAAGFDAGVAAAEEREAQNWAGFCGEVRAITEADDWRARVARAERDSRMRAERRMTNPAAWAKVATAAGIPAEALARSFGVALPPPQQRRRSA